MLEIRFMAWFLMLSLKLGLYYSSSNDRLEGTEDLGEYGRTEKPAQYAMVFMAKGLSSKWKQTLAYFSFFQKSINPDIKSHASRLTGKIENIRSLSVTKIHATELFLKS